MSTTRVGIALSIAAVAWLAAGCQGKPPESAVKNDGVVEDQPAPDGPATPASDGPVTVTREFCAGAGCEIVLRFSRDMVPGNRIASARPLPVTLEPAQKGRWAWRSARELVFTPAPGALMWGHEIRLSMAPAVPLEGARFAMTSPYEDQFTVPFFQLAGKVAYWPVQEGRPRLIEVVGGTWEAIGAGPVYLLYDQPVAPRAIEKHLRLSHGGEALPLVVERPASMGDLWTGELATEHLVAVRATRLPDDGQQVRLQVPAILEPRGAPEIAERTLVVHTRFAFEGMQHGRQRGLPPRVEERPELTMRFTTAISHEAFRRSVRIEPAPEDLDGPWIYGGEVSFRPRLVPGKRYVVTIARDLRDRLGNRLEAGTRFAIHAHDRAPRVALPGQPVVLEKARAEIPARLTNVEAVTWQLAPLEQESFRRQAEQGATCTAPAGAARSLEHRAALNTVASARVPATGATYGCLTVTGKGTGSRGGQPVTASVLVHATELAVTAKLHAGGVMAWVTSVSKGAPVAGARVEILDANGVAAGSGVTGADGVVRIASAALDPAKRGHLGYLTATLGRDSTLARVERDALSEPWQFGLQGTVRDIEPLAASVFTDRGVYRPAETVRIGIIARQADRRARARGAVGVEIRDSRGSELISREVALDDFGVANLDVPLPKRARVGRYTMTVRQDDRVASHAFLVEEYRVPTFEVAVKAPGAWRPEELATAEIAARYLHGGELAGRDVTYSITREAVPFTPATYPRYRFSAPDVPLPDAAVDDGQARLDEDGRLRVSFEPAHPSAVGPMRYVIDATVTDLDRQVYRGRAARVVHPTGFYLGVSMPEERFVAAGDTLPVSIVAVDPDGEPVRGVDAQVRLVRVDHHTSARLAGGDVDVTNRPVKKTVGTCKLRLDGRAGRCELRVPEAGSYQVVARARDDAGRLVVAGGELAATGGNPVAWPRFEHERIEVIADKQRYRVGETAKLLVQTPFPRARGLLVLEQDGVVEHRVFDIDGDTPALEVPIRTAHAPNVFASVVLLRGRVHDQRDATGFETGAPALRMGYVELPVEPDDYRMDVAIEAGAAQAHPGDTVEVTVRARDARGQAADGTAVVMVVDEAVLGLTAHRTPDPLASIFARGALGVRTLSTVLDLPSSRRARRERIFPGGGGGWDESGDVLDGAGLEMRSLFESTAYWNAEVRLGADGTATVPVKLPDNVTTYRLMAVIAGAEGRAGAADTTLLVRKPLIVQPVLPRFVRDGDDLVVEARVFNGTGRTATAQLRASFAGLAGDTPPQRAEIAAGKSARFRFPVKVVGRDAVNVRFAAELAGHRDAISVDLPVRELGLTRSRVVKKLVTGADTLTLDLPPDRVPGSTHLEITASSSSLSQLGGAVEYLMDYPNGCIEQTTSTAYPLVVLEDLLPEMGVTVDEKKLAEYTKAGVERLLSFQTSTGGLAYWPGSDKPHAFGTAFALTALIEAKKRGYDVPQQALDRTAHYLERTLRSGEITDEMPHGGMPDADTRALFVMTLGRLGKPQPSYISTLWRERAKLTPFGLSLLAVAIDESAGDKALLAQVLAEIRSRAKETDDEAYYEGEPDQGWSMGSPLRTHAAALLAYAEASPGHALQGKLLTGLINRQKHGLWGNTQENVFGIMGVAGAVGSAVERAPQPALVVNGKRIARARLERQGKGNLVARIEDGELAGTRQTIAVDTGGKPAYVIVRASYQLPPTREHRAPQARGFEIARRYDRVEGAAAGKAVDPGAVPLGSIVRVTVRVKSERQHHYVALDDRLPAGLEPLNANLVTTQDIARGKASEAVLRGLRVLSHSEIRDDRVAFYADELPAGTYEFQYLARATTPGRFARAAASVEAMYQPEVFGASAIDTVVIE